MTNTDAGADDVSVDVHGDFDTEHEVSELPEDVLITQKCPNAGGEGRRDDRHNTVSTQKLTIPDADGDGDHELGLLLHFKCSCGYEKRKVIL